MGMAAYSYGGDMAPVGAPAAVAYSYGAPTAAPTEAALTNPPVDTTTSVPAGVVGSNAAYLDYHNSGKFSAGKSYEISVCLDDVNEHVLKMTAAGDKADSGWNHAGLDIYWEKAPGDKRQLVKDAKVKFKDPSKTPKWSSIARHKVKR